MDFAARHFLKRQGFEPGKDIVLIQIGSSADIVPAMTNGVVESGVMSVPYLFIARRLGLFANWPTCHKREFATLKRRWSPREAFSRTRVTSSDSLSGRWSRRPTILRLVRRRACGYWVDIRTDDAEILKQALITMFIGCFLRRRIFAQRISNYCWRKRR